MNRRHGKKRESSRHRRVLIPAHPPRAERLREQFKKQANTGPVRYGVLPPVKTTTTKQEPKS